MRKNEEWIKELKVGDEVAVLHNSFYSKNNYYILKVVKITPSGRLELSDGSKYMSDGKLIGAEYKYPLRQLTPEIINIVERRDRLSKIRFDLFKGGLSKERLDILLEWQDELLKRREDDFNEEE